MSRFKYLYPDTILIIFAREPVSGQVKTRLIPALGEEGANHLYRKLLNDTIDKHTRTVLRDNCFSPVNLCVTPESDKDYFLQMDCSQWFVLTQQVGDELGSRMYNALSSALQSYSKAILIGTDCPFLSRDDIQKAIVALDSKDMVFSPASDGGYVLVGARKLPNGVFEHIDWGTEHVMAQSRQILMAQGVNWHELSVQNDIDVKEDLKYLSELAEYKKFCLF